MEITTPQYRVWVDAQAATICFEGVLGEGSQSAYAPIEDLMRSVLGPGPAKITVDVRKLSHADEAGINALYKFAIAMRKRGGGSLVVLASKQHAWQGKTLPNLKSFNGNVEVQLS